MKPKVLPEPPDMMQQPWIFVATTDLSFDQRMIRICSALAENGRTVELCGRELPLSPALAPQAFTQHRLRCAFHRGKLFYLEFNLRLLIYLLRKKPRLICAVDLDTLAAAYVASRLTGATLVYDAHEYFTEVPELIGRPLTKKIWEGLAGFVLPKIRHAYTVSESLAEILSNRYGIPFRVVRNMPLYKPLRDVPKTIPPVILYQGALNQGRGLETAIEAMRYLPQAQLWLAGEGDLSEALRRQARESGLEDRVRFLGKLAPDALAELTPKATIGLNLLEPGSLNYYYSLANKAFDYVQAGLPSIQMNFPEYRRLNAAWECFALLADLNTEALTATLQNLLYDEQRYQTLHQNCRSAAQEWHWEAEKERLLTFFAEVGA